MAIEFYKPDGAKTSRGVTAFALGCLLLYGSISLYESYEGHAWAAPFTGWGEVLGEEFPLSIRTFLTLAVIAGSAFGIFKLVNHPRYVDFLIETEAELKKVTWPSRAEVISSSTIVVLTTLVLALYIFGVDQILIWIKLNVNPQEWFGG